MTATRSRARRARRLPMAAAAAIVAWLPCAAPAAPLIQVDSFTLAGVPGTGFVGFAEFDPGLGALESVDVQVSGTLAVGVALGPGGSVGPQVDFDAIGAGGRGFAFAGDGARFFFPLVTNPSPTAPAFPVVATSFTLDFTLTALSDLTGVVVPGTSASGGATLVPPTTVEAARADFIRGLAAIGIFETLVFTPVNFTPSGGFSGGGAAILTYRFRPVADASVAAPGGMVAMMAAFLPLYRRWRRGPAQA